MALARLALAAIVLAGLVGCRSLGEGGSGDHPTVRSLSRATAALESLPPPARRINVAVYEFPDLTGQNKPNDNYADYSRAVTQGASAIVLEALRRAGRGAWFRVVERSALDNLLKERELIQSTYGALKRDPERLVAPLEFAEYLVQGGIVSFDANIAAGGIGASYLGLAGDANYRKDRVVVALRLTRVRTGEVVASVTSSRTIYSTTVSAGLTRYVSIDDLFSVSGGLTRSDAAHAAVQEAIELAVIEMIREGAAAGAWAFAAGPAEPLHTGALAAPPGGAPLALAALAAPAKEAAPQAAPAAAPPSAPAAEHGATSVAAVAAENPDGYWLRQLRRHRR